MGKLIIITAPSGSGKTTVVHHLLNKYDELAFSISATSRERRPYEEDGKDYYFISAKKFKKLIKKGAFVEWEEVYEDQFYGTLKKEVKRLWKEGKHIVFDVDVEGAMSIKKAYPDKSLAVFLRVPSLKILEERLKTRKTETKKSLKKRLKRAKKEFKYEKKFDMVLVNDILDETLKKAEKIVEEFIF